MKTEIVKYLTEREHVDNNQEGPSTKPWGTPLQTGEVLDFVVNIELMTVREVGDEPMECCALDPH